MMTTEYPPMITCTPLTTDRPTCSNVTSELLALGCCRSGEEWQARWGGRGVSITGSDSGSGSGSGAGSEWFGGKQLTCSPRSTSYPPTHLHPLSAGASHWLLLLLLLLLLVMMMSSQGCHRHTEQGRGGYWGVPQRGGYQTGVPQRGVPQRGGYRDVPVLLERQPMSRGWLRGP